jgi:hypothetical protein
LNWLCDGKMLQGDVERAGYYTTQKIVARTLWRVSGELQERIQFMSEVMDVDGGAA